MLTCLRNIDLYAPQHLGKRDLIFAAEKIEQLAPPVSFTGGSLPVKVFDCDGLSAFPGFIDQHVHILGAGGEQGFGSRANDVGHEEILKAGVTTLVGLLGTDDCTRSLINLYAKARCLELHGITTYLYCGSYTLPPVTFTGSVKTDLVLIDKALGVGEIAIADHRSSQPEPRDLIKYASEAHVGGMLGEKAGVVHLHVGDGNDGLKVLWDTLDCSDLPKEIFVPTHLNRSAALFESAIKYCAAGGNIDLTSGETVGLSVPNALRRLFERGMDVSRVTVSSDAGGSIPAGGVTKIQSLYDDIRNSILELHLNTEAVLQTVTENVARLLKIYPRKGVLREGSDADVLITDKDLNVKMVFGMGKLLLQNGSLQC